MSTSSASSDAGGRDVGGRQEQRARRRRPDARGRQRLPADPRQADRAEVEVVEALPGDAGTHTARRRRRSRARAARPGGSRSGGAAASSSASPVVPTKPITSPARTAAAVDRERRERREVRVVELVPEPVAQPEPVAADVVPADREERAVRDREDRRAERREDVLAVVPAVVGATGAERVDERSRAVDREDVAAAG